MGNSKAVAGRKPQLILAHCPNCGHDGAIDTLSLGASPVMVCSAFVDPKEARTVAVGDIDLVTCKGCGFLYSRTFDQALALAGAQYESSQAASPHFSAFAKSLAKDWVDRYGLAGKKVVEIGCGQGEFLVELIRAGAGTGVGVDPLFLNEFIPEDLRSVISADAHNFCDADIAATGDALVCRHAIEHIGDVAGFLALVAQWAKAHPGAPVLFEAPAAERILAEGAYWDVFYEHCNYFTQHSLNDAFRRAGLDVKRCELVYDQQYLLIEAVGLSPAITQSNPAAVALALEESRRFSKAVHAAIIQTRAQIKAMAAEGAPVVLWQGASKAVALMTCLGADIPVAFAVDLNKRRHGQFLPPFGLQVLPPTSLIDAKPRHVILLNPVYMKEVRADLDRMGLSGAHLHSINDIILQEARAA